MECAHFEERLSEYVEGNLQPDDHALVRDHLQGCRSCSGLAQEIRSILTACKFFPKLDPDPALADRILLRTSRAPRTRTLQELVSRSFLRPLFMPRFVVGTVLASLFMILLVNLIVPRATTAASALSPKNLFLQVDRVAQHLYSEGLKAYDKQNEWQSQLVFRKNTFFNRLGFMIEHLYVPAEGNQNFGNPPEEQKRIPEGKVSLLQLLV